MVTVIVPNYNHSKYLPHRLNSIFNQTFQDFEVIILDDYSTDNSKEIIENYRTNNKVSHIIFNEENGGTSYKQWYKGIEYAEGELVWIAESDDYCDPRFLDVFVNYFQDLDVSLVYCQSFYINESDTVINKMELSNKQVSYQGNEFIKTKMIFRNHIYNSSMVVFRKSHYESVKDRGYSKMKLCGDWLLWSQIMRDHKIVFVEDKLNYFRQHQSNTTRKFSKNGLDLIEGIVVIKEGMQLINNNERHNIYKNILSFYDQLKDTYNFKTKSIVFFSFLKNEKYLFVYLIYVLPLRFFKRLIKKMLFYCI